jgi:hypothetical protein
MLKGIKQEFNSQANRPVYRGTQGLLGSKNTAHCPKGWYRTPADQESFEEGPVPFELGSSAGREEERTRELHATRRKSEKADVGDFGAATDRLEANLATYRGMTQEERAEWIYAKTHAEYVPPFVHPEPRQAKGGVWNGFNGSK